MVTSGNTSSNLGRQIAHFELSDLFNATAAIYQSLPGQIYTCSKWGHQAKTCHHNPAPGHGNLQLQLAQVDQDWEIVAKIVFPRKKISFRYFVSGK